MNKFGKIFALAVLIFLVGVNFASAMPAGEMRDIAIFEKEETENQDAPEDPIISYGPSDPEPLGPTDEVDALGPYGTPGDPYYEGDNVTFDADIINGSVMDYRFRWDVNNDGVWERNFWETTEGETIYVHEFTDDHIGLAKVEAWDGSSMETISGNGTIFNESMPTTNGSAGFYATVGVKFTVNQDLTIYQLGAFNESYLDIYNIRLWTEGGTLLVQKTNPNIPIGTWEWFDNPPVSLTAGNSYIVSIGYQGNFTPCVDNPGETPDGMIDPTDFMYYMNTPYGFPGSSYGSSPLPLVDVRYEWWYQVPDTLEDYADVYVLNVAPTVEAGPDQSGMTGEPIQLNGSFTDPGTDDTHGYMWDFGDGNTSTKNLTPTHTYLSEGIYNVTLAVTDDDGGVGIDYLTVIINKTKKVKDHVNELIDDVENLNLTVGLENALLSKLKNALKCYEKGNLVAAMNLLNAFIKHIQAQSGKKIPEIEADPLIESARIIIDMIMDER
jgi:PKD repeat protein